MVFTLSYLGSMMPLLATPPLGPIPAVVNDAVKLLVGLEIADRPKTVQPPVDILKLDTTGASWVCPTAECPDIHKHPQRKGSNMQFKPLPEAPS